MELDTLIRRKLRCYGLKQCKRRGKAVRFLKSLGVPNDIAWTLGRGAYVLDYGFLGSAKYFSLTSRKLVRKGAQDGPTQKLPRTAVKKDPLRFQLLGEGIITKRILL